MNITDRDQKILLDIQDYGLLTSKLIASKHFPGVQQTTVLRRLRMLESAKYIQKIDGLENESSAWGLTEFGGEELNGRATKTSFPRAIIEHDLTLTRLRLRLEEFGLARAWIPEHVLRRKIAASQPHKKFKRMNVPDGLMGFETQLGNKVSYAIELELTAKSQKRYREIFKQYENRSQLRAYWYIVRKQSLGAQIMKASLHGSHRFGDGEPYLYWSLLDDVMADPLTAFVHAYHGKCRLTELIKPCEKSAHAPAQDMSTQQSNTAPISTP